MPNPDRMQRSFSLEEISIFSRAIFNFIDNHLRGGVEDLETLSSPQVFPIAKGQSISVGMGHSNHGTDAYRISYEVVDQGIPLAVYINPTLGYVSIFLKADSPLPLAVPFNQDRLGNILQEYKIHSLDLGLVKKYLGSLSKTVTIE